VFLVASIILFWNDVTPRKLVGEVLFLQNYLGGISAHTWSLAVEEHFYIGLAIIVFLLLKYFGSFRSIPLLFVLVAITCLTLRGLMAYYRGVNHFPTHFRIDSLFFGVLISYFWHFKSWDVSPFFKKHRYLLALGGTILMLPFFAGNSAESRVVFVFGLTVIYIASGMLLVAFLQMDMRRLKPLAMIGMYSYSIYLWHLPVIRVLMWYEMPWWPMIVLYLTGAIGIGIVMSKLVEYPALKLRNRWFPSSVKSV